MARRRDYDRETFASRIRDIVAEKGTTETAKRFGKTADTIRQWATGKRAPAARDSIIDKVNRSHAAQQKTFKAPEHAEKLAKTYGPEKTRSATVLEYMKVLDNAHPLSRKAKADLQSLHEQGFTVTWTGSKVIPVSGVRIAPAMSVDNKTPPPRGGAMAIGLTASYSTGEKGKRQERVHGIIQQKINRAVYRTMGPKAYPENMTIKAFNEATAKIHLETPTSKHKRPAIYLGFSDLD
jgi:hypothetical protein